MNIVARQAVDPHRAKPSPTGFSPWKTGGSTRASRRSRRIGHLGRPCAGSEGDAHGGPDGSDPPRSWRSQAGAVRIQLESAAQPCRPVDADRFLYETRILR